MRAWLWPALAELALMAPALAAPDPEAGERVVYDVVLQGRPTGRVEEFRRDDGGLYAPRALLVELGVPVPPGDSAWVRLADVTGLATTVDAANQSLSLRLAAALRPPTTLRFLDAADDAPQPLAFGAALDYTLSTQVSGGDTDTGARLAPRVFGAFGVVAGDVVYRSDGAPRWLRVETYWQKDLPDSLRQWRVGDAITPGPAWSRAVRYAGVHYGSDYGLRPDLVTWPMPAFAGEAAVPSAVDIVVNGLTMRRTEVPDGPFSIPRLPVVTGGGEALVVVADALGRESVYRVPFYVGTKLLRAGLVAFSFDAGALRRGYADDYGDAFASTGWRYGVTDALTLEGEVQATERLHRAGVGAVARVAQLGAIQASVARSDGAQCDGTQLYFSSEWQRGRYSLNTAHAWTRGDYCDLAAIDGSAPPRRQGQITLGVATTLGQFSASRIDRSDRDGRLRFDTLNWSRRIAANAYLSLGVQRTRDTDGRRDTAAQFSLLVPFADGATSFSVDGVGGQRDRTIAGLRRQPPVGPGWGWYVESALERHDVRAGGQWRTPWTVLSLDVDDGRGDTAARIGAEGAVAWLGGDVYASRRLGDAFAVVDTGDAADVPIHRENQWLGRTGTNGRLLVTELRPFEANHVGLEPRALPPDAEASTDRLVLRPYRGGGIVASFGVQRAGARDLRLLLADGMPAPLGSALVVDGSERQRVGYDGLVHVEPPATGATWELHGAFGRCRLVPVDAATLRCTGAQ
jgi:outer membrane usher protein